MSVTLPARFTSADLRLETFEVDDQEHPEKQLTVLGRWEGLAGPTATD